jgi:hypothetical protein
LKTKEEKRRFFKNKGEKKRGEEKEKEKGGKSEGGGREMIEGDEREVLRKREEIEDRQDKTKQGKEIRQERWERGHFITLHNNSLYFTTSLLPSTLLSSLHLPSLFSLYNTLLHPYTSKSLFYYRIMSRIGILIISLYILFI